MHPNVVSQPLVASPAHAPRAHATTAPSAPWVLALGALLLSLLPSLTADAAGYGRFQLGGRGVAQVGAFVARADDPHAVFYNPAGITELDGLQVAGGIDFSNATDEFHQPGGLLLNGLPGGTFRADHSIQFPPSAYVTWSDRERLGRWSLGFGVDTPHWYRVDFDPALFPLRFASRVNELEVWQLHPVAAYRLNDQWSVGGGLRYQLGSTTWGRNQVIEVSDRPEGPFLPVEFLRDAEADVDGLGFDLGVQYRSTLWGFGALYRSETDLDGDGRESLAIRDAASPEARELGQLVLDASATAFKVGVTLPSELQAGVWFAPYPELRLEVDVVLTGWSDAEQTFSTFAIPGGLSIGRTPTALMQGFDDTLSVRLGVEGDLSEFLAVSGGVAWEESPIPDDQASPAWPRGDAMVYALGASFRYERVRFDLGYSFHDHDDTDLFVETIVRERLGTFSSDSQVWSASARYTF